MVVGGPRVGVLVAGMDLEKESITSGWRNWASLPPQAECGGPTQLLVQLADGVLTVGDTHEYAEPFAFDVDEDAYGHLRARRRRCSAARSAGAKTLGRVRTVRLPGVS